MKKRLLCCILLSILVLTGCRGSQNSNTEGTEITSHSQSMEREPDADSEETQREVKDVVISTDVEIPKNINDIKDAPEAECFYEDDTYEYYFLKPMSAYITVNYEDGTSENIKDAFANGHVELGDFRKEHYFDIFVKKKNSVEGSTPKLMNVAPLSGGGFTTPATETFYRQGKYRYYYSSGYSSYIYAYYDDGTREKMVSALEAKRITIEEVTAYQYGGIKVLDIVDVVDLTANGDISCEQQQEEIVEGERYKFYFDCVKSQYIELHYKNGEKETLRDLMDAGELTEKMMDEIRGWDIAGLKRERVPSPIKEIIHSYYNRTPMALDVKAVRDPELLYEDEKYQYHLEFSTSAIVNYENGTYDHNIKTAVNSGRVTIYDLGKAGIGCFVCEKNPVEGAEPKLFYIVDSKIEDGAENAVFYEDATYTYSISDTNIAHIYAYYTDGTRQPIKEALKAGRITIADLDANSIEYTKEVK